MKVEALRPLQNSTVLYGLISHQNHTNVSQDLARFITQLSGHLSLQLRPHNNVPKQIPVRAPFHVDETERKVLDPLQDPAEID